MSRVFDAMFRRLTPVPARPRIVRLAAELVHCEPSRAREALGCHCFTTISPRFFLELPPVPTGSRVEDDSESVRPSFHSGLWMFHPKKYGRHRRRYLALLFFLVFFESESSILAAFLSFLNSLAYTNASKARGKVCPRWTQTVRCADRRSVHPGVMRLS